MPSQILASSWLDHRHLLQCIICAGQLSATATALTCKTCGRRFAISNGVLVTSADLVGSNRITANFYDSPRWEKYRFWKRFTPFNERAVSKWRAEVFEYLSDLDHTRLLDVAIGAGLTVPMVTDTCEIFGVDISIQQLNDCQSNNPGRQMALVLGEAERLPFVDSTFDNVLSFGAFNYFNDPLRSLKEMARVTKHNGRIVITDEYPDLPQRMIGHRIGWPDLDRWILSRLLHLGNDFAGLVNEHCELKIEPIIDQVLDEWHLRDVCNQVAYCVVGRVTK